MFENVTKYETEHPDENWTGYISYCKVCGDLIVRIDGDADVECSCKCAISTDGHTAGSAIERIAVTKNTKYYANMDSEAIPVSDLVDFGTQFKTMYVANAPKIVLMSAMIQPDPNPTVTTTATPTPTLTTSSTSSKKSKSSKNSSTNSSGSEE